MYQIPLTESDLSLGSQPVFSSHAEGGLYQVLVTWQRDSYVGLRDIQVDCAWTDAEGKPRTKSNGFSVNSTSVLDILNGLITLDHPSDFSVNVTDAGGSGTFSGQLSVYVARLKEEGN